MHILHWMSIVNAGGGENSEQESRESGPLSVLNTNFGMTAMLELCPGKPPHRHMKALIDARICLISGALRLAHESFHSAQRSSRALKFLGLVGGYCLLEME